MHTWIDDSIDDSLINHMWMIDDSLIDD